MPAPSLLDKITLPFIFLLAVCLLPAAASASSQDQAADDGAFVHQALLEQVQQFLYQQARQMGDEVVIEIRPPSPHLPACTAPEPFRVNPGRPLLGSVSIGVRCGHEQRQVRYMQAQIDVIGDYPVARQDIPRGEVLTERALSMHSGNLADLAPNTLTDSQALIGMQAQRPIAEGAAFSSRDVQAPILVERGQQVAVIAQGGAFRVSREGQALDDGARGERVRVRFANREIIQAQVIARGELKIDF